MKPMRHAAAAALAVVLLVSCNGGNDSGDTGLGATPPRPRLRARSTRSAGTGSPAQDGAEPKGTLTAVAVSGSTVLFGRTAIGGTNGCGTIFSINPDGSGYNLQYRFGGSDGCDPRHDAMVIDPASGALYGTTQGVNQATSRQRTATGDRPSRSRRRRRSRPRSRPSTRSRIRRRRRRRSTARSSTARSRSTRPRAAVRAVGRRRRDQRRHAVRDEPERHAVRRPLRLQQGQWPRPARPHRAAGGRAVRHRAQGRKLPVDTPGTSSYGYGSVYAYTLTTPRATGRRNACCTCSRARRTTAHSPTTAT